MDIVGTTRTGIMALHGANATQCKHTKPAAVYGMHALWLCGDYLRIDFFKSLAELERKLYLESVTHNTLILPH